jgi:hypothetical protein
MQIDGGDAWWLEPVTWRIILCTFRVANALGHGFVEEGSESPCPRDAKVRAQHCPAVEDEVIVELKVVGVSSDVHMPQRLAGEGQAPVSTDQLRSPQSRNPPRHPLLRGLSRPSLPTSTIPFISIFSSSAFKERSQPPPCITSFLWRLKRQRYTKLVLRKDIFNF